MDEEIGVISSMIVRTRAEDVTALGVRIEEFPDTEISAQDPVGKLVVVMEANNDRDLADRMKEIGELPGVLGVNLVFHHNENAQ